MTQAEMDSERTEKEKSGMRYVDTSLPSGVVVRVFFDATAYDLGGFGGRYVKFDETGVWDYDSPGGNLQNSHADKQYAVKNEILTKVWKSI